MDSRERSVPELRDGPITVLYVDDDRQLAETVVAYLERIDDRLDVLVESTAAAGLDRLSDADVDCVVSDYQMPGTDGLEFLDAVRERNAELPFILYTAHGSEQVASDALSIGATDYLQKRSTRDDYELLANRIRNAVEGYRSRQRAADLDRAQTLVRDVNRSLVRASTREEIESEVCRAVSATEQYRFVWIGRLDRENNRIEPTAAAGVPDEYFERITVTTDEQPTGQGPGGRAIRNRQVEASQHIHEDPTFDPWRDAVVDQDVGAVCAVPLEYDATLFGLLVVGAGQPYAFDGTERDLLAELGDDLAYALDSTETKRELERERDRRGALFENSPDPVVEVSLSGETPIVRRVNDAFEDTFGFESDAIVGNPIADELVPESEREIHDALMQRVSQGEVVELEARRQTTGDVREFHLRAIPIDPTDISEGAYAWFTDISERKQRQRELEATRRRFEAVFNNPIAFMAILDPDGTVVEINETALAFIGRDADSIVGKPFPETPWWSHSETLQNDLQTWIERAAAGGLVRFEADNVSPDGDTVTIDGVLHPVVDEEGAVVSILAAGRDISRRKQHEQEIQRQNERLEEFANVVSHDLRNPLDVASGRLQLVRDEYQSEDLETAAAALERIAEIIDDVLTIAQAGRTVDSTERVSLSAIVRECRTTVDTDRAEVRVESDRTLEADPGRLRHVFENLFRNAVEHGSTNDGRDPEVTITVGATDEGFYVADDGPGIPPDEREAVFDAGYSTAADGTGLGLNIVEQMIESHGWEIRLTDVDEGVRFEITGVDPVE